MKSGLNLVELAKEIERRANAKKDYVARTEAIGMVAPDDNPRSVSEVSLVLSNDLAYGINAIGHQQIGQYVEIPKPYYDKMLSDAPDLLATNVNKWLSKTPANRMVRTIDGKVRAFLSDKYRPLENEDLAQAVLPALLEMDLDIMSSQITDRRLYIKAVDKKVSRELKAIGGKFGDGGHNIVRCLAPAITISNSEVGEGALSVLGGVYDGFCSNLASFGERSARKYHTGTKHEIGGEDTYAMLSDQTRKLTDKALWAQVGDIVRGAFNRASFDALCDKIAETATHKIDGDPIKVVELTTKRFRMNEEEGKSILRHLIEGADLTRFGLYNAVTRASQDLESYDRATDFERMGAQIIELPKTEWTTLAKAA